MNFRIHLRPTLLVLATLGLVLAACAPPAAQVVPEESTAEPATPPEATSAPGASPVEAARAWLASQLGLQAEALVLAGEKPAEWPDGCLGLPQFGEACTEAIVPGWAFSFEAAGQAYEVRTDDSGVNIRLAPPVVDSELAGTSWILEAFESGGTVASVVAPGSINLDFQTDGQAVGSGGCNSYGGAYQVGPGTLTFGAIASTLMACAEPDLMGQETQYYEALQNASVYVLNGDTLTITHSGGTLIFTRRLADGPSPEPHETQARVPAIINFFADGTEGVLTAPDTVTAGEDFTITISTFGGGCVTVGDAAVVVNAAGADVLVYDFTSALTADAVCDASLVRLTHTVTLRFDQPGEMHLRVWGRHLGPDGPALGEPTVIEHTLTVQ